ncbi:MAG: hypothetical protein B7Z74_06060, partial [Deltaproteobacteria bacterium 21-66-5]
MLLFAEAQFRLNQRQGDNCTLREHLIAAWRMTGVEPAELAEAPSLPPFRFAMSGAALLCAASESSAVCSMYKSSRPGLSCTVCHASGLPALCAPLFMMA